MSLLSRNGTCRADAGLLLSPVLRPMTTLPRAERLLLMDRASARRSSLVSPLFFRLSLPARSTRFSLPAGAHNTWGFSFSATSLIAQGSVQHPGPCVRDRLWCELIQAPHERSWVNRSRSMHTDPMTGYIRLYTRLECSPRGACWLRRSQQAPVLMQQPVRLHRCGSKLRPCTANAQQVYARRSVHSRFKHRKCIRPLPGQACVFERKQQYLPLAAALMLPT